MYNFVSFLAMIFSFGGNALVNLKLKVGFLIWIVSNVLWIVVNFMSTFPNWFQIAMFVVYAAFNVWGWLAWKHKEKAEQARMDELRRQLRAEIEQELKEKYNLK